MVSEVFAFSFIFSVPFGYPLAYTGQLGDMEMCAPKADAMEAAVEPSPYGTIFVYVFALVVSVSITCPRLFVPGHTMVTAGSDAQSADGHNAASSSSRITTSLTRVFMVIPFVQLLQ
jgi:hypothetical protein